MIALVKRLPIKLDWVCYMFLMLNVLDCTLTSLLLNTGLYDEVNHWQFYSELAIWLKLPIAVGIIMALSWQRTVMKMLTVGMALIVGWLYVNYAFVTYWEWL